MSPNDPLRQLPSPKTIYSHIGHLVRELQLARRLLRLVMSVEQEQAVRPIRQIEASRASNN